MAESLFVRAGLSEKLAATTAANAHHTAELTALLERFVPGCSTPGTQVDEARLHRLGPLLHMVMASWPKKGSVASRAVIEAMVGDGQLDSLVRVKEVRVFFFFERVEVALHTRGPPGTAGGCRGKRGVGDPGVAAHALRRGRHAGSG